MVDKLPPFPVDELTLNQLEHALGTCYGEVDPETGNHELVGGEFTLSQFLDFMAGTMGHDPNAVLLQEGRDESELPEWERGRWANAPIYEDTRLHYTEHSVIEALIAEVRRLRAKYEGETDGG